MSNAARYVHNTRPHSTFNHFCQEMFQKSHGKMFPLIFFKFNNKEYILIVNMFSEYLFTFKMLTKTAENVAYKFTQLFSQYGTPKCLLTDNGPSFLSETFAKFMLNQRVDHIASSPHYPKSIGFIEHQIKTIKTALATATASGKTLDNFLLHTRSTPIGPNLPFPQQILHNTQKNTQESLYTQSTLRKLEMI